MPKCDQCDSVTINGVFVHERGCPNTRKECKWCGSPTKGEFCDDICAACYRGYPEEV
jgi:hypothetical protein